MLETPHHPYRGDIDGLRAVAVIGVILSHADLGCPGGFVGVDVFFVISGYLITGLILKDLARGTFSILEFWERRIRRIVPALSAMALATLLAGWFLFLPAAFAALGKSIVGLATMASNVQFWRESGYFEESGKEKPLLHLWSLAVEEQFYLFFPLFLLLIIRVRGMRRVSLPLFIVAFASFIVSVYGSVRFPSATFYLLPTRAWELLVGGLLASLPLDRLGEAPRWREWGVSIGLLAILLPYFLYDDTMTFPGLSALPPVLGTALVIAGGQGRGSLPFASRLLRLRPLVFVGLASYSLYLWHWPVLAFARYSLLTPPHLGERLVFVATGMALGVASWRFVERPFRRRSVLASRPRLMTATAFVFLTMLGGGPAIRQGEGFKERLPSRALRFVTTGAIEPSFQRSLNIEDVPDRLTPLGDSDAPPEVLVWGDSHAMAILPALAQLCRESGISGRAATHSSTAPALNYFVRARHGLNEESIPFNAAVLEYVRTAKIRKVLLAATWSSYFEDQEFSDAMLATTDALQSAGASVYFMTDVPIYPFHVPKALALSTWQGRDRSSIALPLAEYDSRNRKVVNFLPTLQKRGVVILDPMPILRAGRASDAILPFDNAGALYGDRRHLSTHGALTLKPLFAALFSRGE